MIHEMNVRFNEDGSVTWEAMVGYLADMLRMIPQFATPDSSSSSSMRFYPDPTTDDSEETRELNEDWKDLVKPELFDLFASAVEVVQKDLKQIDWTEEELGSITIPKEHIDAWLNALNQARINLASRYGLLEQELEHIPKHPMENPGDLAKFQIHFMGMLQETLLSSWERHSEE